MEKLSVIIARDSEHVPPKEFANAILNQSLDKDYFELILVLFTEEEQAWQALYKNLKDRISIIVDVVKGGSRASMANHGLKKSSNPITLFLADDFVPSPELFKLHFDAHQLNVDGKLIMFGPGVSPPEQRESSDFLCWLEDSGQLFGVSFTGKKAIAHYYFYIANASVRRELVDLAGGFNEKFRYNAGDDYELGIRMKKLGAVSQFNPDAIAIHDHPVKEAERYRQVYYSGFSTPLMFSTFRNWLVFAKGFAKMCIFLLESVANKEDQELRWKYNCQRAYMKGFVDYFLLREKPV